MEETTGILDVAFEDEITRRLSSIESKIENGRFVSKDVFLIATEEYKRRMDVVEESNRWFMRLLVSMFIGILVEGAMLVFALVK